LERLLVSYKRQVDIISAMFQGIFHIAFQVRMPVWVIASIDCCAASCNLGRLVLQEGVLQAFNLLTHSLNMLYLICTGRGGCSETR
jgi:hypothetical protein